MNIRFHDKTTYYKLDGNMNVWTGEDYIKLKKSAQTKFNLSHEFNLYGKFRGDEININNIDDIKTASGSETKDQKEQPNKHFKVIHLYIKVSDTFDNNNIAKSMVIDDNYLNENKDNLNEQELFHHYGPERKRADAQIDDDNHLHVESGVCYSFIQHKFTQTTFYISNSEINHTKNINIHKFQDYYYVNIT